MGLLKCVPSHISHPQEQECAGRSLRSKPSARSRPSARPPRWRSWRRDRCLPAQQWQRRGCLRCWCRRAGPSPGTRPPAPPRRVTRTRRCRDPPPARLAGLGTALTPRGDYSQLRGTLARITSFVAQTGPEHRLQPRLGWLLGSVSKQRWAVELPTPRGCTEQKTSAPSPHQACHGRLLASGACPADREHVAAQRLPHAFGIFRGNQELRLSACARRVSCCQSALGFHP